MFSGFDYGTSNCAMGIITPNKKVQLLELEQGKAFIPSTLYALERELICEQVGLGIKQEQHKQAFLDLRANALAQARRIRQQEGLDASEQSLFFGRAAFEEYYEFPEEGYFVKSPKSFLGASGLRSEQVFFFEDIVTAMMQNVKTQAFRIPVGQYKITSKVGDVTETATINLTATKGIHHIFLMPAAAGSTTPPRPNPPTPPPPSGTRLGSIRLSASTKIGRRPVNADFLIEGVGNNNVEIARNLKTKAFRIPTGRYKVTAKIGNVTETATINLTATKGIHHIFLMPASNSTSTTSPATPSVSTPPANSAGLGSLRLSASTEVGRRPVAVDLFVEKMNGDDIRNVSSVTTQLFRLPAGQYKTTAKLGDKVVTKDINLTATQGVHHIFLMPT